MNRIDELIERLCPDEVEYRSLGEVCELARGVRVVKKNLAEEGDIPVFQNALKPLGFNVESNRRGEMAFVICAGAAGQIGYSKVAFWAADDCYTVESALMNDRFLYHLLLNQQHKLLSQVRKASIPRLSRTAIEKLRIPVPPMSVQEEIVRVLDTLTELEAELEAKLEAELEARKAQYAYYRDELIADCPSTEWVRLVDIAENRNRDRKPIKKDQRVAGDTPYYGASGIVDYVDGFTHDGDYLLLSEDGANLLARSTPIAFQISGRNWVNNHAHVLRIENANLRKLIEIYLNSISLEPYVSKGAQPKLTKQKMEEIVVPLPSNGDLERIVGLLDQFDALVNDIAHGLSAEIDARRKQYAYYRDKLLTFKEKTA